MPNEPILIIENNKKTRKLVRDILRFKGYQVLACETAEEGIRLAREKKPSLILMDFHLPGMNGIGAFKVLRADPRTKSIPVISIPVIAVTASAIPEDRQIMVEAGRDGVRTKPIKVKDFLENVAATLKKFAVAA